MKVIFIGSGNVATHLSMALQQRGITIAQIYSRTASNAQHLAQKLGTACTTHLSEVQKDADVYIYATKDSSIVEIIRQMNIPEAIHVHTAGSMPMDVFKDCTPLYGVFYPLQTFSIHKPVDFKQIPICVEGCNPQVEKVLLEVATLLSDQVFSLSSEQRKKLHLSAIFACNFTNYMYDIAAQVLEESDIPFDIILPLIQETADKVKTLSPYRAQTGPAVRFDENIIHKHLQLLTDRPDLRKIYQELSTSIHQRHKTG